MERLRVSLPSKLFFRIGEVAGLVGVEPHVLRYWEREFRSIRPTKSAKGQRVYSRKDVENLLRVRDLLYRDGFTIAGAKKRLASPSAEPEPEPEPELENAGAESASDVGVELAPLSAASAFALDDLDEQADNEAPTSTTDIAVDSRAKLAALRAEVEGFLDELDDRTDQREPA